MDLPFFEADQAPQPPEQVRVVGAQAAPYADGRRVKARVSLTPFLERPDVELRIANQAGETLAEAAVIECVEQEFELTLHLRQAPPGAATCRLEVIACYPDRNLRSSFSVGFELPAGAG